MERSQKGETKHSIERKMKKRLRSNCYEKSVKKKKEDKERLNNKDRNDQRFKDK